MTAMGQDVPCKIVAKYACHTNMLFIVFKNKISPFYRVPQACNAKPFHEFCGARVHNLCKIQISDLAFNFLNLSSLHEYAVSSFKFLHIFLSILKAHFHKFCLTL